MAEGCCASAVNGADSGIKVYLEALELNYKNGQIGLNGKVAKVVPYFVSELSC